MSKSKFSHSGNILLIGFGGMLIMMSVLVYLAMKQDIPMVSKHYYEQELVYQQKLNAMNNTHPYDPDFSFEKSAADLTIQLPVVLSSQLTSGTIVFYCPATEKMDREETLVASASGRYTFPLSQLPGRGYIAKITLHSGGRDYYKELKLDEVQ